MATTWIKKQKIKESGLDGINISIDSLDRETFKNNWARSFTGNFRRDKKITRT